MATAQKIESSVSPSHRTLGGAEFLGTLVYRWDGGQRAYDVYRDGDHIAVRHNKMGEPEKVSLSLSPRWKGGKGTPWAFGAQVIERCLIRGDKYLVESHAKPHWMKKKHLVKVDGFRKWVSECAL